VRDHVPGKLPNDLGEGNAREWISADNNNNDAFRVLRGLCFVPTTGELLGPLNLRMLCTYLKCLSQFAGSGPMLSCSKEVPAYPYTPSNPKYVMLFAEQMGANMRCSSCGKAIERALVMVCPFLKLPAKSCGMKHHLKFDLEKCYTSGSIAQPDAWSANLDILSLQREHLYFPCLLSLIMESELKVDLEQSEILKQAPALQAF
jgi:hypothetical protein